MEMQHMREKGFLKMGSEGMRIYVNFGSCTSHPLRAGNTCKYQQYFVKISDILLLYCGNINCNGNTANGVVINIPPQGDGKTITNNYERRV